VVNDIYNFHGGTSEFSSLICNIKNVLMLDLNFVIKFIKRQTNMVVHTLTNGHSLGYLMPNNKVNLKT
jgi:hypothetical protein